MATIASCIRPAINKMTVEERAMVNVFLSLGKGAADEMKNMKPAALKRHWDGKQSVKSIADALNTSFEEGTGFWDALCGRYEDYGEQLDYTIRKLLVKALKSDRPEFEYEADSKKGALEREQWIVEIFLDRWWKKLPKKARAEISKQIVEEVRKKGFDPTKAAEVGSALLTGGLTATRAIVGFQFHIVLAKMAGFVSRLIVAPLLGRGISIAGMAALQRVAGIAFGPIGWVVTIVSLMPTIIGLIAPREYDKYIPVVFLIGLKRLATEKKAA